MGLRVRRPGGEEGLGRRGERGGGGTGIWSGFVEGGEMGRRWWGVGLVAIMGGRAGLPGPKVSAVPLTKGLLDAMDRTRFSRDVLALRLSGDCFRAFALDGSCAEIMEL